MGWQDDPIVESKKPWESDPEVGAPKKKGGDSSLSRDAAIVGGAMWKGATSLLDSAEAIGNPMALIQRNMRGEQGPFESAPNNLLKIVNAAFGGGFNGETIKPETSGEKMLDATVSAGTGALAGPGQGLRAAVMPVISGVSAGAAGEAVKQGGGGTLGEIFASLLGGMTPYGVKSLASGIGSKMADVGATVGAKMGNQSSINRLATDYAERVSGPDRDFIKAAERAADTYVPGANPTTAEAIAQRNAMTPDVRAGATVKLQKDLTGALGAEDILPSVAKRQKQAMVDKINELAGGSTRKAQDIAQREAAVKAANEAGPLREQALKNANLAGTVGEDLAAKADGLSGAATQKVADVRRFEGAKDRAETAGTEFGRRGNNWPSGQATGMPSAGGRNSYQQELANRAEKVSQGAADESLLLGDAARFTKMQADSLAQNGFFPLKSGPVLANVRRQMNSPGNRASDVVTKTLGAVDEKIAALSNKNGVIDSRDLYTVRKEIGNTIAKFADESKTWDQRLTAGLEKQIKSYIDDAIEGAGGTTWKEYLGTHRALKSQEDRLAVAQALSEKLANEGGSLTSNSFLSVLGRGEDTLLKNKFGMPRDTSLEKVFGNDFVNVENVAKQLARSDKVNEIANPVKGLGTSGMGANEVVQIPHMLNSTATVTNFILKKMGSGANEPVAREIAQRMANGTYGELLTRPAGDPKRAIVEALLRASAGTVGAQ